MAAASDVRIGIRTDLDGGLPVWARRVWVDAPAPNHDAARGSSTLIELPAPIQCFALLGGARAAAKHSPTGILGSAIPPGLALVGASFVIATCIGLPLATVFLPSYKPRPAPGAQVLLFLWRLLLSLFTLPLRFTRCHSFEQLYHTGLTLSAPASLIPPTDTRQASNPPPICAPHSPSSLC